MANYYDNSDTSQRFQPGTTVRANEVDGKFDAVAAGFSQVATEVVRSLKMPDDGSTYEVAATATQRRRKVVGFDANGDMTLLDGFSWRGDFASSTDYFVNDVIREIGTNDLYIVRERHMSGSSIDMSKVETLINVSDVENAKDAAEAAESAAATSESNAATSESNALASENKAQDWAENPEDVEVDPGEYSAKHHALKAAASAQSVDDDFLLDRPNHTGTQLLSTISDAGTAAGLDTGTGPDQLPKNSEINTGVPVGTRMLFYQASAPTGWTQLTSINDRMLRVVSGNGGTTGGNWSISGLSVAGHTLTVSEMPSHDHNMGNAGSHSHSGSTNNTGSHTHGVRAGLNGSATWDALNREANSSIGTSYDAIRSDGSHSHSLSINSNGSHSHNIYNKGGSNAHSHGISHDGNWRPSYADVIVCEKG